MLVKSSTYIKVKDLALIQKMKYYKINKKDYLGGGQEWAMRMKRNRENKYVKSREPGSVVVTGHGQKEDINLVL